MSTDRRQLALTLAPPLMLAAVVGAVYLRTLAPGALGGDAGELQFIPVILSLPHPTGTPLYVLLSKLWSLLPLGPSVAWRMNLLAAISATGAVVVVYIALRSQTGSLPAAVGGALSLAFGLTFWEQALIADKYAFNALLVAAVLALALRWGQTRSPRTLIALALVYGLSLAHHRTMLLLGPPLFGYVWWIEGRSLWRDGRRLLRLAALCAAPLLLYLYLPWAQARNLPPGTWSPHTAREWLGYLLDRGYTSQMQVGGADLGQQLLLYARTLQRDFGWAGVALAALGLAKQMRSNRQKASFLLVCYTAQAFLAANYHVPRHWVYFLPSFVIVALWAGEGAGVLWRRLREVSEASRGSPDRGLTLRTALRWACLGTLAVALMAWPCPPLRERYRPLRQASLGAGVLDPWRQTLKSGRMADRLGAAIADVASGATIVADWEQATPLWYYQQVLGWRPDVRIVYPVERLVQEETRDRPLYLARTLPGLDARWHPSAVGPLVELARAPRTTLPGEARPSDLAFARPLDAHPLIALAGYALGPEPHVTGAVLPVTLHWRAVQSPNADYSVSVRLLGPDGAMLQQADSQHPVLGMAPTSRWQPGEMVSDYYELPLPIELAPGAYTVAVTLYRGLSGGGWESLRAADGSELAAVSTFALVAR